MSAPAVEVTELVKEFPETSETPPRRVLDKLNFSLAEGEALAVTGPSGCGKSTLLNLIGLLDRPTSGEVLLAGQPTSTQTEAARATLRAKHIGFVFQLHHLLPQCSVLENVLVPTLALPPSERQGAVERAQTLLERVGLHNRASSFPQALSGGERQRVAVVRALINQPRLILADEPTGSLDQENARSVAKLLQELAQASHAAYILVTHDHTLAESMGRMLRLR